VQLGDSAGQGPQFGIAPECMLKVTESSCSYPQVFPQHLDCQGFETSGERGRTRTCDPCLKRVANTITNNNLHVQLTPCTTEQNQLDANKTSVWVPGGCPEPGLSNNVTLVCWILCNAKESFRRTIQHPAFSVCELQLATTTYMTTDGTVSHCKELPGIRSVGRKLWVTLPRGVCSNVD
jgi:hypothetical protein